MSGAGSSAVAGHRIALSSSDGLELVGGNLAGASVLDQLEADLLTFAQVIHPGALDGADVNECILAAVVGLNESKTLLCIIPFNCADSHVDLF